LAQRLLTSTDLMSAKKGIPAWLPSVYQQFHDYVSKPEFPCDFGTSSELQGLLRYTYSQSSDLEFLQTTLSRFLELSRKYPRRRYALVLFEEPQEGHLTLNQYRKRFWEILQFLHDNDPSSWPDGVPMSTDDPQWEFSFGGDSMFVFGSCPAYLKRRSRNLGPSLVLLFQPRRVFRGIEGGTPSGSIVRERIRCKLRTYDTVRDHPDMGAYSDQTSFEWKQYFIPDDTVPELEACPLTIHHMSSEDSTDTFSILDQERSI
jgi:FPC/CPF motif-containing protein YcgG